MKTVALHTLGCKLNFAETSSIAREFEERGFVRVKFGEAADVVFINTCSVTALADKKCRQAIQKARKTSPEALIAVTGCYAQSDSEDIACMPEVDLVLGMDEKFNFFTYFQQIEKKERAAVYSCETEAIARFHSAYSSGKERTRAFLKVQDGCNYPCTYCKIPSVRGKSRSKSIRSLLEDAMQIAAQGVKEIVLTGINVGDFGCGTNESFFQLIKELDRVEGVERFRISSIEPNLLTEEIIDFVGNSSKFLPHFHIPLQSGCNKILRLMKRRYRRELFAQRIASINRRMPEAFIGVDVIVGFPGETEEDFCETYDFLRQLDISFLHVFSYSSREGTPAAGMKGHLPQSEIKDRSKRLHLLSDEKNLCFKQRFVDTSHPVLFEAGRSGGNMFGFTENYIKVQIPYEKEKINTIRMFHISDFMTNGNAQGVVL